MDIDKIEKIINEKITFDISSIFGGNNPLVNSRELAELIASESNDIHNVVVSSSNICTDTGEECKYNCSGLCEERC